MATEGGQPGPVEAIHEILLNRENELPQEVNESSGGGPPTPQQLARTPLSHLIDPEGNKLAQLAELYNNKLAPGPLDETPSDVLDDAPSFASDDALDEERPVQEAAADNNIELESIKNKITVLEEAVNRVTGATPRLELVTVESPDEEPLEDGAAETKPVKKETMKPVIEKAMDVFGGHVVRDHMEDQK